MEQEYSAKGDKPLGKGISASEVTHANLEEMDLKTRLLAIYQYLSVEKKVLHEYIPEKMGIRPSSVFRLMVFVWGNPRISATGLRSFGCDSHAVDRGLKYLVALGLCRKVNKPRLIIPFGAYKVDVGYMVSDKGLMALKRMLGA